MNRREFTLDRFTRGVLVALTVLLTIIVIELWAGRPTMTPEARAQVPDSGAQRNQMIEETRRTNQLLEQILDHLRTKPVKVKTVDTDKADERPGKTGKP
jgi:hypothetical protein